MTTETQKSASERREELGLRLEGVKWKTVEVPDSDEARALVRIEEHPTDEDLVGWTMILYDSRITENGLEFEAEVWGRFRNDKAIPREELGESELKYENDAAILFEDIIDYETIPFLES